MATVHKLCKDEHRITHRSFGFRLVAVWSIAFDHDVARHDSLALQAGLGTIFPKMIGQPLIGGAAWPSKRVVELFSLFI